MSEVRADVLARLLLLHSVAGRFSDEDDVCGFVRRGLEDIPGVSSVEHSPSPGAQIPVPRDERQAIFRIAVGARDHGQLLLRLTDPTAFQPYAPYVGNLCFMVAIILEERQQRRLNEQYQRELESRVALRTSLLSREVEERKAAEALAEAQRQRAERYLEVIEALVVELNLEGQIELINAHGAHVLGYEPEDIIGKNWFDLAMPPELTAQVREMFSSLVSGREDVGRYQENEILTRSGERRLIAWRSAVRRTPSGEIAGTLSSGVDVTNVRRLLEHAQEAERLSSLGALAGGIAHDFNNLLAGLFGNIELAYTACPSQSEAYQYLRDALTVFERAKSFTQQLLTFAKGGEPVRRVGSLGTTLRNSVAFALSGSSIHCDFEVPEDLWPCRFDANQMARVFDNLAINAKEATPKGGRLLVTAANVTLASDLALGLPAGTYVRVRMQDFGVGMTSETLRRAFDPFFTTKSGGTGLGLATSYSIIQRHGGRITVESSPGQGTTFDICLPASPREQTLVATASTRVEHRGAGTIVVMDDEPLVRRLTGRMLRILGYEAVEVDDGQMAIEVCRSCRGNSVDLAAVILDLTIRGGKGGAETAIELRSLVPEVPLFAATGYSADPVLASPAAFGFTAGIAKPFALGELSQMLSRYLEKRPPGVRVDSGQEIHAQQP